MGTLVEEGWRAAGSERAEGVGSTVSGQKVFTAAGMFKPRLGDVKWLPQRVYR